MNRLNWWLFRLWGAWLLLALAAAFPGAVGFGAAKAFGELATLVTLTPTTVTIGTTFRAAYFTGLVAELSNSMLTSMPSLAENTLVATGSGFQLVLPSPAGSSFIRFQAYHKQDIVLDWPVGVWGVVSELAFSWDGAQHYLWGHAWIHYAGVALTLKLALARSGMASGSGLEWGFEGTTLGGVALRIASQFGLTTDRSSLERAVVRGTVSGEMFEYRGTTLTTSGMVFCCLNLSGTARFTKSGFEYAQIESAYTYTFTEGQASMNLIVEFRTQTKLVTLVPRIALGGTDCELYLTWSLVPSLLDATSSILDGIELYGIGLLPLRVGGVTVSGLYSLSGSVYKRSGEDDIRLRAHNYALTGGMGSGMLPYDLVCSLEYSAVDASFAGDAYFSPTGTYLFGLALVTLQVNLPLMGEFQSLVGLAIATDTGLQRLIWEFKYNFNLYWP